jgi:energy-coupling factor transport system substrate-specific component
LNSAFIKIGVKNMDSLTLTSLIIFVILIIGVILCIFRYFEKSKPSVESIVLIAILVAIASLGRLPTAALLSIQASSFIIIMAGLVFGKEIGFITGVLTAVVTDLFLGIGYWTVFQMIGWGIMGLTAGIFSSKLENVYIRAGFGFIWGFFYGWITDLSMLPFLSTIDLNAFLGIFAASVPFDLSHGVTNVILLVLLYSLFKRIFNRAKDKFLSNQTGPLNKGANT